LVDQFITPPTESLSRSMQVRTKIAEENKVADGFH